MRSPSPSAERLAHSKSSDPADVAQAHDLARLISNPARDELTALAPGDKGFEPPPGMPIGEGGEACWFCDVLGDAP